MSLALYLKVDACPSLQVDFNVNRSNKQSHRKKPKTWEVTTDGNITPSRDSSRDGIFKVCGLTKLSVLKTTIVESSKLQQRLFHWGNA